MSSLRPEVFIVDDDASVRTAVARLLVSAGHAVRTFASAREFLDSQCARKGGCLLLDVRLPDLDGMELQERLRSSAALLPVIFLTGFGDIATSVRAMKSGAMDFLPKPVNDEVLLQAVDVALAEGARVRAADLENEDITRRHETLTPRERDVFLLVLAGRLNKQIARELGISEKTVKVHRGRVMAKMGVRRVAQLVQFAARIGLVRGAGITDTRPGQPLPNALSGPDDRFTPHRGPSVLPRPTLPRPSLSSPA